MQNEPKWQLLTVLVLVLSVPPTTSFSGVSVSVFRSGTTDTNAATKCSGNTFLNGEGQCVPSEEIGQDTNAATECGADEVLLGAGGGCIPLTELVVLGTPRIFFVTSKGFQGNLVGEAQNNFPDQCGSVTEGLEAGDCICQATADEAPTTVPAGTYRAWLSDSTGSPNTRWYHSPGPYVNVNGEIIDNDYSGLTDGSWRLNPSVDENGTDLALGSSRDVWTGTTTLGSSADANCNDWTVSTAEDAAGDPNAGVTDDLNNTLVIERRLPCDRRLFLYCAQQ